MSRTRFGWQHFQKGIVVVKQQPEHVIKNAIEKAFKVFVEEVGMTRHNCPNCTCNNALDKRKGVALL